MSRNTEPLAGQMVWFVRWIQSRDGWSHETISGAFEGRTDTCWRVWVNEELRELSSQEWSPYKP